MVAVLPGSDPQLREQSVVIGAHFDHLGTSPLNALDPDAGQAIRHGADDNASGTAAVLELARLFAASPAAALAGLRQLQRRGARPARLGNTSSTTRRSPLGAVDAMVNFDMVGRLREQRLIVYGVATATELTAMLDSANRRTAASWCVAQGDGFGPSDQSAFYAHDIPVLHFFTDLHEDYHRASDVTEKINAGGEARVVAYAERVIRQIADRPGRLTFVRVATPPAPISGAGYGPYFGSIPDMSAGDEEGVRLSGVRAGSPADKAGVLRGDVIVEFGGAKVRDLYGYTGRLRRPQTRRHRGRGGASQWTIGATERHAHVAQQLTSHSRRPCDSLPRTTVSAPCSSSPRRRPSPLHR